MSYNSTSTHIYNKIVCMPIIFSNTLATLKLQLLDKFYAIQHIINVGGRVTVNNYRFAVLPILSKA